MTEGSVKNNDIKSVCVFDLLSNLLHDRSIGIVVEPVQKQYVIKSCSVCGSVNPVSVRVGLT